MIVNVALEIGQNEAIQNGNEVNLAIDGRTPLGNDVLFVVALCLGHMVQTHDGHC